MRVAVIGGAGRHGSAAAAAIARRGLAGHVTLTDGQTQLAEAEAHDITDAVAHTSTRVTCATIDFAAQSEIIVLATGAPPQPGEPAVDLARRNLERFARTLHELRQAGLRADAMLVVASEPAELLTHFAHAFLGLPAGRVIGRGTVLATRRFRAAVARQLDLPASAVSLTAIGAHGTNCVPLWSGATVGGLPLASITGWPGHAQRQVEAEIAGADTELLAGKGGGWLGPGEAIADIVAAVATGSGALLPVCAPLEGAYGLRKVTLALPFPIGRLGAGKPLPVKLWPKEENALRAAARAFQADFRELSQLF